MQSLALAVRLQCYWQQHYDIHRRKYGECIVMTRKQFVDDLTNRMRFIVFNGGVI